MSTFSCPYRCPFGGRHTVRMEAGPPDIWIAGLARELLPVEFEYFALLLDHALNHNGAFVGPRFVARHTP
jgi:hypothetical protein